MKVASFYPIFFDNSRIGYCTLSISEAMESDAISCSIMATASDKRFSHPMYKDAIPSIFNPLAYMFFTETQRNQYAEWRFLKSLDKEAIAYFWSAGVSLSLYKTLHARGNRIMMESVNTTQVFRKKILDDEYKSLGLPLNHGTTQDSINSENAKLALADFVFSCSPGVRKSLNAANVPDFKVIDTSYGLRKSDILPRSTLENRKKHKEFTAAFVGSIGVRKGIHLLLNYWCKSKVKGKLKLVGNIDEEAKPIVAPYLKRADIEHVPYVNDLKDVYREADAFVLPSLEEGSPLVTYLALGAGLPCIVSPMGAGGLIEHNVDGLILEPHDESAWIQALQQMSEDVKMRQSFSFKAYEKAPSYLWSEVGRKRAEALLAKAKRT